MGCVLNYASNWAPKGGANSNRGRPISLSEPNVPKVPMEESIIDSQLGASDLLIGEST